MTFERIAAVGRFAVALLSFIATELVPLIASF